jgi:hypothetical protein
VPCRPGLLWFVWPWPFDQLPDARPRTRCMHVIALLTVFLSSQYMWSLPACSWRFCEVSCQLEIHTLKVSIFKRWPISTRNFATIISPLPIFNLQQSLTLFCVISSRLGQENLLVIQDSCSQVGFNQSSWTRTSQSLA